MKRGRSKSAPKYRLHKRSGQAVVTINRKDFYLGEFNSAVSKQRYAQVIADHWAMSGQPFKATQRKPEAVTIAVLAIEYGKAMIAKHSEDSKEWKYQIQPVLKAFRATYGALLAEEFGPVRFENFRRTLVEKGVCRQVVKRKSNYILKMFQLGVKFELIPVEWWQRLLAVGPVEMKTKAKKKRRAVPIEIIKATQKQLTPVLRDMVEIHRLIGARPTEVCLVRPCDIDRSQDVWIYTPPSHKTEHHGHSRTIPIGPKAQAVLSRYLFRDPQAYCFTPQEAYEQHLDRRREQRTTPDSCGNGPAPRKPKRFKPSYDHSSYRRAIDRAATRAFPIPKEIEDNSEKVEAWKFKHIWRPNQLRKSAANEVRKQMDLEAAQGVLGHSSKSTTEAFYARLDNERAVEFARNHG